MDCSYCEYLKFCSNPKHFDLFGMNPCTTQHWEPTQILLLACIDEYMKGL